MPSLLVLFFLLLLSPAATLRAQVTKPDLPDPVKFVNKFDIVWNVVRAVLIENDYAIELEDRKAGRIVTRPYEFITGSLTANETGKLATKAEAGTGSLLKARYSLEALLEIVSPTETMVTVRTKFEALNRDVDGTEKWLPLESLGVVEKRVLGKISMKLMGNDSLYEEKKGFWDKSPQPVNPRNSRVPPPPPK